MGDAQPDKPPPSPTRSSARSSRSAGIALPRARLSPECVPSVPAGAEFSQQRRRLVSTRYRPSWMVHTWRAGQAQAAVTSARSRSTSDAIGHHPRLAACGRRYQCTSAVGGWTAALDRSGDHLGGLIDPSQYCTSVEISVIVAPYGGKLRTCVTASAVTRV